MDQLIIDLATIDAARIDATRIHAEFESATARTETVGDWVGHGALAERVHAFAANWDHRRAELTEQLGVLRDNLQMIVDGFTETDQGLADAISERAAEHPAAPPMPEAQ